ncbi:adenylosuccinate lyase [Ruegeria arenilitoris]|uniref:Chitin-binding type-2 domain-containing protein n=1 Tax=Ruegeria arenilitoris TaxID=1173585 RepID=A0A238JYS3_9RHOB|nr:adenylosuccinate lyase [Ruegeria arenilitoris]MBY6081567.1 adenylosuccinate lyase [Ruegeria arenilitoris]SMX35337.1 hypothetical protein RUA8715_00930 [Ruegeria arenilitoris]
MIRTTLCALALALSASSAFACQGHSKQSQSCAPGTTWDSASESCVKNASS